MVKLHGKFRIVKRKYSSGLPMKKVIGLTGGTGSGKSSFAGAVAALGAEIVDADQLGRDLLGNALVKEMTGRLFGNSIYDAEGEVNREMLASFVFHDVKALKKLNALVHPILIRSIHRHIQQYYSSPDNRKLCFIDMALLFELYLHPYCDHILYISAEESNRIQWLKADRRWSEEHIRLRMASQMNERSKAEASDTVIKNNGSLEALRKRAAEIYTELSGTGRQNP
jgi:dephospho-CoA kinase